MVWVCFAVSQELNDILMSAFGLSKAVTGMRVSAGDSLAAFPLSQVCNAPQVLARFQTLSSGSAGGDDGDEDESGGEVLIELVLSGQELRTDVHSVSDAQPGRPASPLVGTWGRATARARPPLATGLIRPSRRAGTTAGSGKS